MRVRHSQEADTPKANVCALSRLVGEYGFRATGKTWKTGK